MNTNTIPEDQQEDATRDEGAARRQVEAMDSPLAHTLMVREGAESTLGLIQFFERTREGFPQWLEQRKQVASMHERLARWERDNQAERRTQAMQQMLLTYGEETSEWFLLRFTESDWREVDVVMEFYGEMRSDLTTWHAWRAFTIAVLFCGIVRGRDTPEQTVAECDNAQRLFKTPEEVSEQISKQGEEPQIMLLRLFGELLTLNLLEQAENPEQKQDRHGDGNDSKNE